MKLRGIFWFVQGSDFLRRVSKDLGALKRGFEDLRKSTPYGPFENAFGLRARMFLGILN